MHNPPPKKTIVTSVINNCTIHQSLQIIKVSSQEVMARQSNHRQIDGAKISPKNRWRVPGLVNVYKKLWTDPPFYSWVNPLFRLGHGFKFAKCKLLPEGMDHQIFPMIFPLYPIFPWYPQTSCLWILRWF